MPDPVKPIVPPTPPRSPLAALDQLPQADGVTTIDATTRIDIDLLAYDTLSEIVDTLAGRLVGILPQPARVVCIDTPFARALEYYDALPGEFVILRSGFVRVVEMAGAELARLSPKTDRQVEEESVAKEAELETAAAAAAAAATAAVPGLTTAVAGAVSLLGAFRQHVEVTGRELTIDPIALVALAVNRLGLGLVSAEILAPSLSLPTLCRSATPGGRAAASDVVTELQSLFGARDAARRALLRLAGRVQLLKVDDPRHVEMRASLDAIREQFDSTDGMLRDLESDLTTEGSDGELSLLQLIRRVEHFCQALRAGTPRPTYLLRLHVVSAGGLYRIVRHALRSLFSGDGLACAAAVTLAWTLSDANSGAIVTAGVERHRLTRASLYRDVDQTEAIRAIVSLIALTLLLLLGYYLWRF